MTTKVSRAGERVIRKERLVCMPNWCRNELRVNPNNWWGGEPEIEVFLDAIRETTDNFKDRVDLWFARERKNNEPRYESCDLARHKFDFNRIIPYPSEFKDRDYAARFLSREEFEVLYPPEKGNKFTSDGYNSGGYEWCLANWGTKWNASTPVWVKEHNTLHFDTARGPAFEIISAIHKHFPNLTFDYEYYERGMAFMGGCTYSSEADWDVDMVPMGKEHEIEMAMKKDGKPPEFKWEAGQAYNYWTQKYDGFKGG
jgi:hypothetical protein